VPYVHEQAAVEHAAQMADRWNRIYMRTLRNLRDLRRYSPVMINNAQQVNIAADGAGRSTFWSRIDEDARASRKRLRAGVTAFSLLVQNRSHTESN
jgi:hypothetical protein